jgi:MurNAc alpha-1-phosphate uridylyltransferase
MDALLLLVPLARAHCHNGTGDFHLSAAGALRRKRPGAVAPFVYTGVQMVSKRLFDGEHPSGPFSTNILWDRAIEQGPLRRSGASRPLVRCRALRPTSKKPRDI